MKSLIISSLIFIYATISISQVNSYSIDASGTFTNNKVIIRWGDIGDQKYSSYQIEYYLKKENTKSPTKTLTISNASTKKVTIDVEQGFDEFCFTVRGMSNTKTKQISSQSEPSVVYLNLPITQHSVSTNLNLILNSFNSSTFPFLFAQVSVNSNGFPIGDLAQNCFAVYENDVLQTDFFQVIPPDSSGGIRIADIIFLIDNSGSMQPEQAAVVANVKDFVDSLVTRGIDMRLGLVRFGQNTNGQYNYNGSPIVEDNGISTADVNYFKNNVLARNFANGSFEPGFHSLVAATQRFAFRPGTQKIFILITDEDNDIGPSPYNYTLSQTLIYLEVISTTVYALADQYFGNSFNDYFASGSITHGTGGKPFQINVDNVTTMLNYIQFQVGGQYTVRYRSSNPLFDNTLRIVQIIVDPCGRFTGEPDTVWASYQPGDAPKIQRTPTTIALSDTGQLYGIPLTIQAWIVDYVAPYVTSAKLYFKRIADISYSSFNMVNILDSLWSANIPGGVVTDPGIQYYITATDGIVTSSDPSTDPTTSPYYIAVLPNEPPKIIHTPIFTYIIGTTIPIYADVLDNTLSVNSVMLYYRKTGTLLYSSVAMLPSVGDTYENLIPSPFTTIDGIDYYIKATDNYGISSYCKFPFKFDPYFPPILTRLQDKYN